MVTEAADFVVLYLEATHPFELLVHSFREKFLENLGLGLRFCGGSSALLVSLNRSRSAKFNDQYPDNIRMELAAAKNRWCCVTCVKGLCITRTPIGPVKTVASPLCAQHVMSSKQYIVPCAQHIVRFETFLLPEKYQMQGCCGVRVG